MQKRILVINPGNISTKVAVYDGEAELLNAKIEHGPEDLAPFPHIYDQRAYRTKLVLAMLQEHQISLESLAAVVGRGGMLKPVAAGTYYVNAAMIADARDAIYGEHASNLGPIVAADIAELAGVPALIADPVSVDEMIPEARLSGLAELPRCSQAHALNCRAVALSVAEQLKRPFQELRMVIAHLGSGISIISYRDGQMIDNSNPLEGGPMSLDRSGALPVRSLIKLAYSGKYSKEELLRKSSRAGGVFDYLGLNDLRPAVAQAEDGDPDAQLVLRSMSYQIAKEIGAFSTTLNGQLDCIVLTGGMAFSEWLVEDLMPRIEWIAPIVLHPGEEEMAALRNAALRVLNEEEQAFDY